MDIDEQRSLSRPLAIAAVVLALLMGVLFGGALDLGKRLFGGPSVETVASSALQAMRAQNRLVPFVARYVSVTSSKVQQLGVFTTERTLVLPGDVRYELDLSKLTPEDVVWNAASKTLSVHLPEIEIAGPDVDLAQAREYGTNGVLSALTHSDATLDQANRARAIADLRAQASAPVPMRLAREAGRQAIERSFSLPLVAAGFDGAKVVARYPTEGDPVTVPLDHSRSYNEGLDEARRRR